VLELDAEAPDEAPAQASPSGEDSGDFTDQRSVAPTQEIHAPRGFVRSRLTPQTRGSDETGETGTFDPEDDRLRTRPGRSAGSPLDLAEIPAGVAQEMLAALTPAAGMQPIGPDERTSESPFVRVTFSPDTQDLALGGGDEEERTVERAAHRADTASEPTVERRSFSPAPLSEPSGRTGRASPHPPLVIVEEQGSFGEPGEPAPPTAQRRHRRSSTKPPPDEDDDRPIHRAQTVPAGVPHEELKQTLESELESAAPAGEAGADRTRRRVSDLIDRAVAASTRGDHPIAIVALDLALAEDPGSAVAQKLIHRHQPAILDCYQRYLGDLSARPGLAMPMHELSGEKLDIRAAFLLSRIDGALTFEEILDVSGMQRAEAFRHLSNLVLRGILTVA
jgi:hypothetical protein